MNASLPRGWHRHGADGDLPGSSVLSADLPSRLAQLRAPSPPAIPAPVADLAASDSDDDSDDIQITRYTARDVALPAPAISAELTGGEVLDLFSAHPSLPIFAVV